MPVYTYRRDDGTTFDFRQKFSDEPLKVDPETGQSVVRVVQAAGVIFKGSGFYVNDSKSASRSSVNNTASHNGDKAEKSDKAEAKAEAKHSAEGKGEGKSSTEAKPAPKAARSEASAAAD